MAKNGEKTAEKIAFISRAADHDINPDTITEWEKSDWFNAAVEAEKPCHHQAPPALSAPNMAIHSSMPCTSTRCVAAPVRSRPAQPTGRESIRGLLRSAG